MSYQSNSYDDFVEDCVKHCTCTYAPCDGVMAGGYCDDINVEDKTFSAEEEWEASGNEDYEEGVE